MPTRREFIQVGLAAGALAATGAAGCGPGASKKVAASPDSAPSEPAPRKPAGPLRILILGGTKFLGPQVVDAAIARGHTVTLFNRGKTNAELFPELEKLVGDRDGDLKALEGRRWDAVVDTSGYVPRVVKASAELLAPSVGHYVFISSISVYADPVAAFSDESARLATLPDPTSEKVEEHYGALKALSEQAAETAMPGRVTSIRPGLIVGPMDPTDRYTYWPARMARGGEVLAPGNGEDPGQYVDARDLGAWIVHVIEEQHVGVYNAVGPAQKLTMKELLGAANQAAGDTAQLTWVDTAFLAQHEVAPWMELPVWTGSELGFATVVAKKAIDRGLGFRPAIDTAKDTLAWWLALPEERRAKPRAGLAPEKEARVLKAWKERKA